MNLVFIQNNFVYRIVFVVYEYLVIFNYDNKVVLELIFFFLKKDLLMIRFLIFDEKLENYFVWKINFRSIMFELYVSFFEEMDLFICWLGLDLVRYVKIIRLLLGFDLLQGVKRIWECMDEWFGVLEMVEVFIKYKFNLFLRFGNKENKKLYELVDIMIEIELLMENLYYFILLLYFNFFLGVFFIIYKFFFNLQEKWMIRVVNYKR